MHTVLVWVLLNLATGQVQSDYRFPTLASCQRAADHYQDASGRGLRRRCISLEEINPYGYSDAPVLPTAAEVYRAQRNYQSEQVHFHELLRTGPSKELHRDH